MKAALLPLLLLSLPVMADGSASDIRANYLLACRGCHLADGRGVPPDVPSLRNTLAQFTTSREGRDYLVRVPGVLQSRLNDEQLAEVINWVLEEFNAETLPADFKPLSTGEVAAARKNILANPVQYRDTLIAESLSE